MSKRRFYGFVYICQHLMLAVGFGGAISYRFSLVRKGCFYCQDSTHDQGALWIRRIKMEFCYSHPLVRYSGSIRCGLQNCARCIQACI